MRILKCITKNSMYRIDKRKQKMNKLLLMQLVRAKLLVSYIDVTVDQWPPFFSAASELELDALNRNPCMPSILAIIDYLVSPSFAAASGTELPKIAGNTGSKTEKEMPKWMSLLLSKITAAGRLVSHQSTIAHLLNLNLKRNSRERPSIHCQDHNQ